MLNRLALGLLLGVLATGLVACAETPKESDEPQKAAAKPPAPEGPYYEVTKDDISSHPDFNSSNIKVMGIKLGDKTTDVAEKSLGPQVGMTIVLADEYQTYYQKNGIALFTFKLTGKIKRIELLQSFSGQVADAKLKGLLASGDLQQMRALFGREESIEEKESIMGTEYLYDARGIRVIRYKSGIVGLRLSEPKK